MPTVIYCDRVKHEVTESVDAIADLIRITQLHPDQAGATDTLVASPAGFIKVSPKTQQPRRVFLRAAAISSYHDAASHGSAATPITLHVDGKQVAASIQRYDDDQRARA